VSAPSDFAFLKLLDRALSTVLAKDVLVCAAEGRFGSVTIELFLGALHARYPQDVQRFFETHDALEKLSSEYCSRSSSRGVMGELWGRLTSISTSKRTSTTGQDEAKVAHAVALDPLLARVLRVAAKVSSAAGRKEVGIEDFVSALSLEPDLLLKLRVERGLTLKDVADR